MFHKSTSGGSSGEKGHSKTPADGPNVKKDKPKRQNSLKDTWASKASPPPELSRDATEAELFFELPVPENDMSRTVINVGTGLMMVWEVINQKSATSDELKKLVDKNLPNLKVVTARFKLHEEITEVVDSESAAHDQLKRILAQLYKLSSNCKFKIEVDAAFLAAGSKEEFDRQQRLNVINVFNIAAKGYAKPVMVD